jgi:hypothetical protein
MTPSPPVFGISITVVMLWERFFVLVRRFPRAWKTPASNENFVRFGSKPPGEAWVQINAPRPGRRRAKLGFFIEELLQLRQFLRILRRKILGFAEVIVEIV